MTDAANAKAMRANDLKSIRYRILLSAKPHQKRNGPICHSISAPPADIG
jgi:hypothetical protein